MKIDASRIIRDFNLRQTKVFSVDDLESLSPEKEVYLRFREGSPLRNRRTNVADLLSSNLVDSEEIQSIEECYCTLAGGASLITREFVYSEYVDGHSNSLLRRGLCSARSLHFKDEKRVLVSCFQGWKAKQGESYSYFPTIGISKLHLDLCCTEVSKLAKHCLPTPSTTLFEWMLTTKGFYYCDAQEKGLDGFFELKRSDILGEKRVRLKASASMLPRHSFVDCFDCELQQNQSSPGKHLTAFNGAVLSHFATRSLLEENVVIDLVINDEASWK